MNVDPVDERLSPPYYRHWVEERVRYRDLDALGHLNSAVYSTYFEQGRVTMLQAAGLPLVGDCDPFALVRQSIDYRKELILGAQVRVGTRITKLGRTSITMAGAIFDGDDCTATAEIIGVLISGKTRRPIELSDELRRRLGHYT